MLRSLMLVPLAMLLISLSAVNDSARKVRFTDVTKEAGIEWRHRNGKTPEKYLIETMGGGGAFLDFDNDGFLDIYLVNSGAHARSKDVSQAGNALYRNNGDGTFSDVTAKAGVEGRGYGMGAAVADYDDDGWTDILVTAYGPLTLYRNLGNGRFEEVSSRAGLKVDQWSTSAAFFDLENDGDVDLFVCVYLEWNFDSNIFCGDRQENRRAYCHPDYFPPISSLLFRNNGDGTFTDITSQAGVALPGKALGVVAGDVNEDGFSDLYVANDAVANFLYLNSGKGTFTESALISEVAYGVTAKPESGMGTDLGDFNSDGRLDLIVTNIDNEMNNLYSNQGEGWFEDVTIPAGLGEVALPFSGFGVRFADYDNDGDLDLVVLNGHVIDNIELSRPGIEYAEPPLLLENREGKFFNVGAHSGPIWSRKIVGRALATGDYDNDGDLDFLFVNNNEPPNLLRNEGSDSAPWLGLQLVGTTSNRDAVGAVVSVTTSQRKIARHRTGGGSYQAGHDPRILIGLREKEQIERIHIRWPSGRMQELSSPELRRYHLVEERNSIAQRHARFGVR